MKRNVAGTKGLGRTLSTMASIWGYFAHGESGCTDLAKYQRSNYFGWYRLEAGHQVTGFSGALHRRYPNLKAAQIAWDDACRAGRVGPPKEWGAARAEEVTPSQPPFSPPQRNPSGPVSMSSRQARRWMPWVDNNLRMLYAIRLAPTPVPSNEMWYVVLKGAYPGVYLGRWAPPLLYLLWAAK